MSRSSLIKSQNYCLALRRELGYPAYAPLNHTLAFSSGGPAHAEKALTLARHAIVMGRDMIYCAWDSFAPAEPTSIALAIRELTHVDVITDCFLWASDAAVPLAIVAPRRNAHFVLGPRGHLERRSGMPAQQLNRGKRLARQRVRRVAMLMSADLLPGNQFVPRGECVAPAAPPQGALVRLA